MNFNYFVFPAPKASYTYQELHDQLIFIPRLSPDEIKVISQQMQENKVVSKILTDEEYQYRRSINNILSPKSEIVKEHVLKKQLRMNGQNFHIPCLYIQQTNTSKKIILYFHGNAEDLGHQRDLLMSVKQKIKADIIAVEYPGYGIYQQPGLEASEKTILEDAHYIMEFLIKIMRIDPNNIIILGRSIGTGPATEMAALFNPAALILISAFTSIQELVKDRIGHAATYLIRNQFNNIENIKTSVKCPVLFVHGQKDSLIPCEHSQSLHSVCQSPSSLVLPKEMDHNEFDFNDDFIQPLYFFLIQASVIGESDNIYTGTEGHGINGTLSQLPEYFKQREQRLRRGHIFCCGRSDGDSLIKQLIRYLIY